MHYSKVVMITLFASATTISAIGPAHYRALQARAYHNRLNARDPIADAYADPYNEESIYARAAFGTEYHAHELDARGLPRTKSPSRQGQGVSDMGEGTSQTPAEQGHLNNHPTGKSN
ncbi:hypothetical protein MMC27_007707, partial [Xylographa pallens]|nr:hypothetical protein [Xylographa pallens]